MAIKELLAGMASKVAAKLGASGQQDGSTGPKDGSADPNGQLSENQKQYGPNFEKLKQLKPDIVSALQQLVLQYRAEGQYAQRHRILRTRYARLFWQGIQYPLPNTGTGGYDLVGTTQGLPSSAGAYGDDPAGERFQYVTNLYQAYGLTFIALVSQDVPSWVPYPKSREVQEDITAARVAYDVGDLVERNNGPHRAMESIARYLWTDGVVVAYVRYVVDGERFGYKEMPVEGTRDVVVDGQRMTVPSDEGAEKIPNGQEVISYGGGLEWLIPFYAEDFNECPYVQWSCEPHKAKLKALYPHAAKGIEADAGLTADQLYERISRLGVKQNISFGIPGDALEMLPTFTRTWFRKWAFRMLDDDKLVAELEALFPDGCYVAFAGMEYCESRNESMNDHIRVLQGIPGDGQARPAVGDCLIDIQERYNTLSNMQAETYEYGIPPIYADPQVLDFDALSNQVAEPAVHFPATAKPGMALGDGFFAPDPAKEPATLAQTMQELIGPVAQFISGLFSAAAGGPMEGVAGKTFGGYKIARDQAMGRIAMIYRRIKKFYADGIGLGLEVFKNNRPEDVEIPFPGENDEEKAKWIRLADFRGNVMVEPEADETFPRMRDEQRAVIQQLLEMGPNIPPNIGDILDEPQNLAYIKNVLGLTELEVPGEDIEIKEKRIIQQLLETGPLQFPPAPQLDPQTGQVAMVQPPPQCSVPVNDIFDLAHAEDALDILVNWANSDQGQTAQKENPKGFLNVYLRAKQYQRAISQKQAAAQPKPPAKPPSMSVQIDKLPPGPMAQALAMDGIQADPNELLANKEQQRADKAADMHARLAAKGQPEGTA